MKHKKYPLLSREQQIAMLYASNEQSELLTLSALPGAVRGSRRAHGVTPRHTCAQNPEEIPLQQRVNNMLSQFKYPTS